MTASDPYLTPADPKTWRFPALRPAALEARFRGQPTEILRAQAFHVLPVAALKALCDPLACWVEQATPITPQEVHACVRAGQAALVDTPLWTDIAFPRGTVSEAQNRENHIRKVAYFVLNPPNSPISIDVGCPNLGCFSNHLIDDGNHRLAGCILADRSFVAVTVGGEVSETKRLGLWNPTPEEQEIGRRDMVAWRAEKQAQEQIGRPRRRSP